MFKAFACALCFLSFWILPRAWAAPRAAVVLLPGTLNSLVPGNIHEDALRRVLEADPYFSADIIEAFQSQGIAVHVARRLSPFGAMVANSEEALREIREWYRRCFPGRDVPLTLVGHSSGGFYALYAAAHAPELPIGKIVMVSTPLGGAELADRAGSGWLGSMTARILSDTGGILDLRGLPELMGDKTRRFLDSIQLHGDVKLYTVVSEIPAPLFPSEYLDARFLSPILFPLSAMIGEPNDGLVSVRSASGPDVRIRDDKGGALAFAPLAGARMRLSHPQEFLDYRLFALIGETHLSAIRDEQRRAYSKIAALAAQP